MGNLKRVAPIFGVVDLEASLRHYERMGFTVRPYDKGGYGFAVRDGLEIHLGVAGDASHERNSAYLFVEDADELAEEWRSAGLEVHGPEDTEWVSTRAQSWTPMTT